MMSTAIKIVLIVYQAIIFSIIAHYIHLTSYFFLLTPYSLLFIAFASVHHNEQCYCHKKEAVSNLEIIYYMLNRQNTLSDNPGNYCQENNQSSDTS